MSSRSVSADATGVQVSPSRIVERFTNRELCLIHQLYQIQLFLNWQANSFGARALRADEWVVYACDFFEPVFRLLHDEGESDHKEQVAILGLAPPGAFPFPWSLIGPDADDEEAADYLAETVTHVISESALLFPEMKPYQRLSLLEVDSGGCRERVAEFFTRSKSIGELSGDPEEDFLPENEPLEVHEWVQKVNSVKDEVDHWIDPSPVQSELGARKSSQVSNRSKQAWESPLSWDDQPSHSLKQDPLDTFVFDPEHRNFSHEGFVTEADGIEYFTSAPGFCAKLSSLVALGIVEDGPELGGRLQGMMRGSALWWLVCECANEERDQLRSSAFVFLHALQRRFPVLFASEARKAFNDSPLLTESLVCGCSDLLRMHALRLCSLAQTAGIADQPGTYVRIWERMGGELQQFFERPDPEAGTYDSFVALLDQGLRRAVIGEKGLLDSVLSQGKGLQEEGGPVVESTDKAQRSAGSSGRDDVSVWPCSSCAARKPPRTKEESSASTTSGFRLRPWRFLPLDLTKPGK